jgi:hypothetical protein
MKRIISISTMVFLLGGIPFLHSKECTSTSDCNTGLTQCFCEGTYRSGNCIYTGPGGECCACYQ